jgi:hypothetical protein
MKWYWWLVIAGGVGFVLLRNKTATQAPGDPGVMDWKDVWGPFGSGVDPSPKIASDFGPSTGAGPITSGCCEPEMFPTPAVTEPITAAAVKAVDPAIYQASPSNSVASIAPLVREPTPAPPPGPLPQVTVIPSYQPAPTVSRTTEPSTLRLATPILDRPIVLKGGYV